MLENDTIAAISTPPGVGGIAVVRVSGPDAISIVSSAWKGADLTKAKSHSVHLGNYYSVDNNLLDQVVATVFINPASFTGENTVEISVHGSSWIQQEILKDLVKRGARIANPGEFTQRAFLNGKLDLAQAEGVADLISASSKAAHDMAINQTKGTFSKEFINLRDKLIEFASLLELELDFSEEEVEFADRSSLLTLLDNILSKINFLSASYAKGAVLKTGVPVVIAGFPNAGKSSLLNLLTGDDKAIVTDIPGTTRDIIEDTIEIDGFLFRFLDTAGLRATTDIIEEIGVKRAYEALKKAYIVIWILDPTQPMDAQMEELSSFSHQHPDKKIITLLNKSDLSSSTSDFSSSLREINEKNISDSPIVFSTLNGDGLPILTSHLVALAKDGQNPETDIIITNARHYEALIKTAESLSRAKESLKTGSPSDLVAQDIREATSHLSTIVGSISSETLLHSIFARFCIGK